MPGGNTCAIGRGPVTMDLPSEYTRTYLPWLLGNTYSPDQCWCNRNTRARRGESEELEIGEGDRRPIMTSWPGRMNPPFLGQDM